MQTLVLSQTDSNTVVKESVLALKSGKLVIFPTETTYGIGADATNQEAVDRLLQYKKKRLGKPLSVAVADEQMASTYVVLNDVARKVYKTFLPGPVTVVSTGKHTVAKGVESDSGTLGIRIPAYPLVLQIIKAFGKPITATGANASYKKRPYTVDDIFSNVSKRQKNLIGLVLDAGELPHNEPSTVIDTTTDDLTVLRQGNISFTEKQEVVTHSADETQRLGKRLIQKYKNHLTHTAMIFCLEGEMGAGKTQFTKGIAEGLGITQIVNSPTFVLAKNYRFEAEGKQTELVHIDTWRMQNDRELLELGLDQMVENKYVVAIEWADRMTSLLKQYVSEAKLMWVKFASGEKADDRHITYSDTPFGEKQ